MRTRGAILASPLLCLGVLSGIAADNARHVKPQDAAPYHARARKVAEAFPYVIGYWAGKDVEVPTAAVKLLQPNVIVSRHFVNQGEHWGSVLEADLLIVQCADSRDMTGHFPPICYPSSGEPLISQRPFKLTCAETDISGTEYIFDSRQERNGMLRKSVYDFFVVPGRGIVPDITDVRSAASDYQRRCFGAAQFQVVMNADLPPEQRDAIFTTLIGADSELIRVLKNPE
jgi:hypothetical protein